MRTLANPKKKTPEIREVRIVTRFDDDPDTSYLEQEGFEDRLEEYRRGDFAFIGLWTEADVIIEGIIQTLSSGGLWGIESDSQRSYVDEVAKEELSQLRDVLEGIGVSKRVIDRAFADVREVER